MAVVDELVTLIGYQIDEKGEAALKASKKAVVEMTLKVAALAAAVVTGRTAFQGWVNGIIDHSMQMQRLSDDTQISTNALEQWGYAAQHIGGDAKSAVSNLQQFQLSLKSVVPGQIPNPGLAMQLPEFRRNGGMELAEVLDQLHQKYSALAAIGQQVQAFRLGHQVGLNDDNIRLLMQQGNAYKQMQTDYDKFAGGLKDGAATSENAKLWQSFDNLKLAAKGYAVSIGNELTPYIQRVVDWTLRWFSENERLHASLLKTAAVKIGQAPEEAKGWWDRLKDSVETVGNSELNWFKSLKEHYPHITAWIQNLATMFKNSFSFDFDVFGKMWRGIKQDGTKILAFLADMGDAMGKIFKAGGWLFDKYLQLTGQIPQGAGATAKIPNPYSAPAQSHTVSGNRIDIHINGAQTPAATGKAVRGAISDYFGLGYGANPQRVY